MATTYAGGRNVLEQMSSEQMSSEQMSWRPELPPASL
jgi:hypothetical protein